MTPIFNTRAQDAHLVGDSNSSYHVDKPNFPEFRVKMAKISESHFQYQPRVSQNACLVQI